ncbi:MAG: ATP-binding protein [bacterium]|nr:ATP-binding protein [bacterium]
MTATTNSEERLLEKRKFYVRFLIIFTVLMLLAFNLGSWIFFDRMDDYLEQELEKRLAAIAGLTAKRIETDYADDISDNLQNDISRLLIQPLLNRLVYEQELESAFIIDRNQLLLVSGISTFSSGEKISYLQQDSLAIEQAWSGIITSSPIHIFKGNKFKSIYAPLHDQFFEVNALLVLEASADFFKLLDLFKQGLIFGGVISLGLMLVFGFFISWMITLLMRTHESLQQSKKLSAMGRMAASMAHEIRNPLGVIKGTADVLKEKYETQAQPEEMFDYIAAEVERLNILVNNFLSFAREPKLNIATHDLKSIIEKSIFAIEREEPQRVVDVQFVVKNKIEPFAFDANAIRQVLFNLLINAKQAIAEQGSIEVILESARHKNRNYAKVTIIDSGIGINQDSEKIFEPFFSTKHTGSGLGLAICKGIIERHGGWIDFESQPKKATKFYFYLPIK